MEEFFSEVIWAPGWGSRRRGLIFLFAGITWVLWKIRNDWVFANKLIPSPNVLPYRIIGFLQHWSKMKTVEDQMEREKMLGRLKEGYG